MRSVPPQHQHRPEDFVLPRLFESLSLTSNAKLFGEAQAGGKMRQTTTLTRIIPATRRRRRRATARLRLAGRDTTTSRSSPGPARSSPGGSTASPRVLGPACTARWPRSGPSSAATTKRGGRAGGGGEVLTARRASTSSTCASRSTP
ncbi:unnamed protein product [Ectocarpus sp. 8 AP-2014]